MQKILIASANKGKVREIKDFFKDLDVEILGLEDVNLQDIEEPEENGLTFEENSLIKAKYYSEKSGYPTLADDSGLCINALDGEPGIYSARWAGTAKDFSHAMNLIKNKLDEKNAEDYNANFTCGITLYIPENNRVKYFEGKVEGTLTFPPRGDNGFGYDPIFIPNGYDKTFAELSLEIKQKLSHRADALNQLKEYLISTK